jgi:hypothetical protein
MVARNARCSRSSNSLSARHATSLALPFSGRRKKLLPFNANDPLFPPSIRLLTTCFQYAACTVSSQILCRFTPGRHAACSALTPRIACLKFGPCHVFFLYASSNSANTSSPIFTVSSRVLSIFRRNLSLDNYLILVYYVPWVISRFRRVPPAYCWRFCFQEPATSLTPLSTTLAKTRGNLHHLSADGRQQVA